jgi:VIT1/CCC1 family predicted Fe2+/Mn2+ transporter
LKGQLQLMVRSQRFRQLQAEHRPDVIRTRLTEVHRHSFLGDAVLGGIDGCVTTFAVVAGAFGGGFPTTVTIILGFANLLADGFSMAVSKYQNTESQREFVDEARRSEERHIEEIPEGEREEIRQIFARKGFADEVLEKIVTVITQDRRLWVDTMLTEEYGLALNGSRPLQAALTTFVAFFVSGLVPLVSYLLPFLTPTQRIVTSAAMTALAFLGIGMAKGIVLQRSPLRSGLETLLVGGAAATLAYLVGWWLRTAFNIA